MKVIEATEMMEMMEIHGTYGCHRSRSCLAQHVVTTLKVVDDAVRPRSTSPVQLLSSESNLGCF